MNVHTQSCLRPREQALGSMMNAKSQLMADSLAWFGNVSTSVAIIFVNKVLMNVSGFGFRYGARVSSIAFWGPTPSKS